MTPYESKIEAVVDSILQDYQCNRDIDKLELHRKPDRDAMIDIIEKLRRIVFPGYFKDKNYQIYNAKHNLSMLIEDVMFNLNRQVALVFQNRGEAEEAAQAHAQDVCVEFFNQIPQVRAMVQTDLQAAYEGDPAATGMAEIIFAYPGLFAIMVYRLAHVLYTLNVPILPVCFLDGNSHFYYSLGLIDWSVRLLRLPSEVFNKAGKPARISLGGIITPQQQDGFEDMEAFRAFLRSCVYDLKR